MLVGSVVVLQKKKLQVYMNNIMFQKQKDRRTSYCLSLVDRLLCALSVVEVVSQCVVCLLFSVKVSAFEVFSYVHKFLYSTAMFCVIIICGP